MGESSWRTTIAQVQKIVATDVTIVGSDGSGLSAFIDTANNLVTQICTGSGYTAETLELIERWLSAHFYSISDTRRASEQAGSVQESVQYKLGLNLQVTIYGQQAMLIDTAGNLGALQKRLALGLAKPGIIWLGEGRRHHHHDDD